MKIPSIPPFISLRVYDIMEKEQVLFDKTEIDLNLDFKMTGSKNMGKMIY